MFLYGAVVDEPVLDAPIYDFSSEVLYETNIELESLEETTNLEITLPELSEPSEVYIIAEGFEYDGISDADAYLKREGLDYYSKSILQYAKLIQEAPTTTKIDISLGGIKKDISYTKANTKLYANRHDFLCNMGVMSTINEPLILSFTEKGTYHIRDLRVVAQPVSSIYEQLDILKHNDTMVLNFGTNSISGNIDASEDEILVLTVPYSDGWTAYVDGIEYKVIKTNTAFCGIQLDKGSHQIELRYMTPGLKIGIWMSMLGCAILIVTELYCIVKVQRKH